MTLVLPRDLERAIREHGREGYPDEVCGFLIGRETVEGQRVVTRIRPAPNAFQGGRRTRFEIHPRELLAVEDELEGTGAQVVGFYHSHPDYPAGPSRTDEESAWPWYSYVVVSIMKGKPLHVTSWRFDDDARRFEEEPLVRRAA